VLNNGNKSSKIDSLFICKIKVNVLKIIFKIFNHRNGDFFFFNLSPFGDLPSWTLSDGENDLEGTVIAVVNLP